jgi:hypothetical protein
LRNRKHSHLHAHTDGTVHEHPHAHVGEHAPAHTPPFAPKHAAAERSGDPTVRKAPVGQTTTPWILFTIFVFGPCEPLVPLLMYPAAELDLLSVAAVAGVFALVTIGAMLTIVAAAVAGLSSVRMPRMERYSHLAAGAALTGCAAAMMVGL